MTKKIVSWGLVSTVGLLAYIFLVSLFFSHAERILGKMPGVLGFSLFLLLFVFSAAISALLVLGRPVWLFINNFKKEAIWQLGSNLSWMLLLFIVFVLVKILI